MAASIAHDPTFALGHASLALLGHELCAEVDVAARLRDASLHAARGTERERSHVHAVVSHVTGDSRPLVAHLAAYPLDALLLSTAVPTIAFAGVTEVPQEAWAIVERAIPAYGDDWWFTGLLAFVRQEQNRFDEAMELSCRSLAVEPGAGHSAHARAHAHYETGDHAAGLAWMDGWVTGDGASIDSLSHFAWHAALHELSLGDLDAVRRRYDVQLRPEHGLGCRALVDTGSLLFRWALTPDATDVPGLEQVAALAGRDVLERPATPFLAMHSAVTLLALDDRPALDRLAQWAGAHDAPDPARGRRSPGPRTAAGSRPDGTARPRTPWPPWPDPADGSAAPTPSASSSRRPGSRRWCAPTGSTRHACSWTTGSIGGIHPETDAGYARLIESPETVIFSSASANVAGPSSTSPVSMEYLLPWQSQLMVPSETLDTRQPWWLQIAVKHLNSPSVGWVTTTSSSAKIVPPPTSMSDVEVSASAAGALSDDAVSLGAALVEPGELAGLEDDDDPDGSAAVSGSSLLHAASRGAPTPAAARPPRVRREILSVVMTAGSSRLSRVERVVERDTTYGLRGQHEEAL